MRGGRMEIRGYLVIVDASPEETLYYVCPEKPKLMGDSINLLMWCNKNCVELTKEYSGKHVIIRNGEAQ